MGCLRNIINLIILGLAIIGFLSIGGKEFLEEKVMPTINKFRAEISTELDKSDKAFTDMSLNEIKDLLWKSSKSTFITKETSKGCEITEIKGLMGQIMVAVENYPQLKSDQTMMTAMHTYNEVEEHIAAARRFYNASVNDLKNAVEIFPGNVIAGMIGVKADMPFFEAEASAKKAIDSTEFFK